MKKERHTPTKTPRKRRCRRFFVTKFQFKLLLRRRRRRRQRFPCRFSTKRVFLLRREFWQFSARTLENVTRTRRSSKSFRIKNAGPCRDESAAAGREVGPARA